MFAKASLLASAVVARVISDAKFVVNVPSAVVARVVSVAKFVVKVASAVVARDTSVANAVEPDVAEAST